MIYGIWGHESSVSANCEAWISLCSGKMQNQTARTNLQGLSTTHPRDPACPQPRSLSCQGHHHGSLLLCPTGQLGKCYDYVEIELQARR